MRIVFKKKDSLYSIFKKLERIPSGRSVEIFVHPENQFFDNIWWWKQIVQLLEDKSIEYVFVCKDSKSKNFFKSLNASFYEEKPNIFVRFLHLIKNFFFYSKDFHSKLLQKRSGFMYVFVWLEAGVVLFVFYLFYWYISPSATVYLQPSYSIEDITYNFRYVPIEEYESYKEKEYITIPYFQWGWTITIEDTISVQNIDRMQEPASWEINIINESQEDIPLRPNTRFVTNNWKVFRTNDRVRLLPWEENQVEVEAERVDENGQVIGDRGNIEEDERLLIRNLDLSYQQEQIYAYPVEQFTGGITMEDAEVTSEDIDRLKTTLEEYVEESQRDILEANIDSEEVIYLPFDEFIDFEVGDFETDAWVWDETNSISGEIEFELYYKLISRENMKEWIKEYVSERSADNLYLFDIKKDTLLFNEIFSYESEAVIPTSIDVVRGYDFEKDVNSLKEEIKERIIWESISDAEDIILDYDEIDVVIIRSSPPWYDVLPSLKSRIELEIDK